MDIMQEFEKYILDKNKDVLQRLKYNNSLSQESVDTSSRIKNVLDKGYPVYAIIEHSNVTRNVEIINGGSWDADSVTVKQNDGTEFQVPITSVKMIKF